MTGILKIGLVGFGLFDLPLTFLFSSHHHLEKMSFSFYFFFY